MPQTERYLGVPPGALADVLKGKAGAMLRPDPHVAAGEIDVTEVWGEELELLPEGTSGQKEPE